MRPTLTSLTALILCLAGLLAPRVAHAIPPLPSSFYGTVQINGANVPDGTLVRALIDGQAYAEARTQTYEGSSVYSVDVKGDDTDTPERDGGVEGSVVSFEVGGVLVEQKGSWRAGTNVELNLIGSTAGALEPPSAPRPSVPTQTPIGYTAPEALSSQPASRSGRPVPWLGLGAAVIAVALGGIWVVRRRR